MLRPQQLVHRPAEGIPVQLLDDIVYAVHIPLHHTAQNVRAGHLIPRYLYPLDGGQLTPYQLLQGLLHLRIAVVAQLRGKAHHRGLTDGGRLAQPRGGHKRRAVIIVQYKRCDALLSLRKGIHPGPDGL